MTWAMSRGLLVSHDFVIIYPRSGTSDINLMFGAFYTGLFPYLHKIQVPITGTIYTKGLQMMITTKTEHFLAIEIDWGASDVRIRVWSSDFWQRSVDILYRQTFWISKVFLFFFQFFAFISNNTVHWKSRPNFKINKSNQIAPFISVS